MLKLEDSSKIEMSISLYNSNTGESIPLCTFYEGMIEDDIKASQETFLKNLLYDTDNNQVRMSSNTDSFAKWNVPYSDVENDSKAAKDNISDIYDDDILGAAATTFDYRIQGIAVNNPLHEGTPRFKQVSNSDNAAPTKPLDTPTIVASGQAESNGAIVDSDSGIILEEKPKVPTTAAQENAKKVSSNIVEDSKKLSLSEDGAYYVDSETGERYTRVTSVISADEQGERFDPNNPWVTPSTNIGTSVDEFVRDFFARREQGDTSKSQKEHPNASKEQWDSFEEQLEGLYNNLTANGLTVIPRDVTVTGSIDVLDSEGNLRKVKVAGTLDLLAYDSNGNFYIFDMKTYHSEINSNKKAKYAKQLSLYKDFLENKYGVKVSSLNIIPIKVSYPDPKGSRRGTVEYSVSESTPNQLLADGKTFKNAAPYLDSTMKVDYTTLHIVWDKLSDKDREVASIIETAAQDQGISIPVEAAVEEPAQEAIIDPLLGVPVNDDYLGGMFGIDIPIGDMGIDFQTRTTPVPEHLKWSKLTQEDRDNLTMMGYDETSWHNKTDEEMEHDIKCLHS